MAGQRNFWKGEIKRTNGREDGLRGNPEAPAMHHGPGEFDMDMKTGSDSPNIGTSQPRAKGNKSTDELPLKHANVHPRRQQKQVLMAHALRMHMGGNRLADDGTSTAAIGGGAGSAAGGGS